jgi:hypothetical protein
MGSRWNILDVSFVLMSLFECWCSDQLIQTWLLEGMKEILDLLSTPISRYGYNLINELPSNSAVTCWEEILYTTCNEVSSTSKPETWYGNVNGHQTEIWEDFFYWLYSPCGPWPLFSLLDLFTIGRTPWISDQLVARPLSKHRTAQTQNKHIYTPNIYALSGIRTHDRLPWPPWWLRRVEMVLLKAHIL